MTHDNPNPTKQVAQTQLCYFVSRRYYLLAGLGKKYIELLQDDDLLTSYGTLDWPVATESLL